VIRSVGVIYFDIISFCLFTQCEMVLSTIFQLLSSIYRKLRSMGVETFVREICVVIILFSSDFKYYKEKVVD
jgi:hypothetical protein